MYNAQAGSGIALRSRHGEVSNIKMYSEVEGLLDLKALDAENRAYFGGV